MKLAGIIDGGVTMREVLRIIAGNICITGAYAFITVPCHIVNGGITSFSMILHNFINMDISFFYKRHNNTAAYFMFFPAREKLSFKISSKQYMLYAFFQYLLCTEHRFSTPYAACSFNGVCNGRLWLLFMYQFQFQHGWF